MTYYKGIDVLADAIANYSGTFHFVVAGSGDIPAAIKQGLKRENTVLINRALSEGEKSWLLSQCEALAFPSQQKTEAFGIVQLEAMAHSKPIINTALATGVPEVARDQKEAITVGLGSAHQLTRAFKALENQSTRHHLGQQAFERLQTHFSQARVSDLLRQSFADL